MQASAIAARRAAARAPLCGFGRSFIDFGARIYSNINCFDVSGPTLATIEAVATGSTTDRWRHDSRFAGSDGGPQHRTLVASRASYSAHA